MLPAIIASLIFLSYFIESIFGFGGSILAIVSVGSFIDIKDAIYLITYCSILCSGFVLLSDWRSLSLRHLFNIFKFALPGILIGAFLLTVLSSPLLLKVFAVFLIAYSLYSLLKPSFKLTGMLSRFVLFCGGVVQGVYATGGPFVLMGYGANFEGKSVTRSTMAGFFVLANVIRIIQLNLMGAFNVQMVASYWWMILPIAGAVFGGFAIHKKLDEALFKRGVLVLILFAGVFYLVK